MALGATKFVGLAVRDRSILAAEVRINRGQREVHLAGEFVFPENLGWDRPEALGAALRHFLRLNRFSASRAVVGIPARWMMAREKEIPPAGPELAANTLRLQAERDFAAEIKDLVFDYAGQPNTSKAQKVLLVAMPRQKLEQITQMADEAGLSVLAVTSASLALTGALNGSMPGRLALVLGPDAAELVVHGSSAPRMLRHLPVAGIDQGVGNGQASATYAAALGSEVRRVVSLMPQDGASDAAIFLWNGAGLPAETGSAIGQRSGLDISMRTDLALLRVAPVGDRVKDPGGFGTAIALALAGEQRDVPLDFLHARLAPPKKQRISQRTLIYTLLGVVLLGALGWLGYDVHQKQSALNDLNAQLKQMQPGVEAAQKVDTKVRLARRWYDNRPPILACMRDVTRAFPPDDQIWATSLTFRDNRRGNLSAKTLDNRHILTLIERLNTNKSFSDVKLVDMREAGGRTREIVFSLSFTYTGVE